LSIRGIDHFSINVVKPSKEMLVFSIRPEIAYSVYSSPKGIAEDLAISPTFYENLNFYFWEDCYKEKNKEQFMLKKEYRFGILAGAVIVYKKHGVHYLFSFASKTSREEFKQNIFINRMAYKAIAINVLELIQCSINKYIYPHCVQNKCKVINICDQ
ncbi:MAG: hypothetical protein KC414_11740, partial [Romboutsia sp.]|nr:hypothetical protein [Romboutsia sp.]